MLCNKNKNKYFQYPFYMSTTGTNTKLRWPTRNELAVAWQLPADSDSDLDFSEIFENSDAESSSSTKNLVQRDFNQQGHSVGDRSKRYQ